MFEMIVCHCHVITDRDIRACVRSGATTAAHVGDACGAATGCGGCQELVEELVDDELAAQGSQHRPSLPVFGQSLTR